MSENQIFQIPNDLSRRLTRNNTKETRENWFKGYDTIEKRNLERQLPPIPLEPVHPGSERFQEIEFPKTLLIFSGILLICLILTGFQGWLVLSHFGASAFLIESQMRTSNPKLHFMEAIKSHLGYLALGTALLTTVFFLYLVIGDGPRGIPICFDLLVIGAIVTTKLQPWIVERSTERLSRNWSTIYNDRRNTRSGYDSTCTIYTNSTRA
jgi:hypothetical protein